MLLVVTCALDTNEIANKAISTGKIFFRYIVSLVLRSQRKGIISELRLSFINKVLGNYYLTIAAPINNLA